MLARSVWTPRGIDVPVTVSAFTNAPVLPPAKTRFPAPERVRPLAGAEAQAVLPQVSQPETPPPEAIQA